MERGTLFSLFVTTSWVGLATLRMSFLSNNCLDFGFFLFTNRGGALLRRLVARIDGVGKSLTSSSLSGSSSFCSLLQVFVVRFRLSLISLRSSILNTSSALHLDGENNLWFSVQLVNLR